MYYLWYSLWYDLRVYALVYWIIASIFFGLYVRATGESKWYIGCIPLINIYIKNKLGCVAWPLLIFQCYATILAFLKPPAWPILAATIIKIFVDLKFGKVYLNNSSHLVFALVPFAKYIIMFKEARQCANIIKATPIWSTKKMES